MKRRLWSGFKCELHFKFQMLSFFLNKSNCALSEKYFFVILRRIFLEIIEFKLGLSCDLLKNHKVILFKKTTRGKNKNYEP